MIHLADSDAFRPSLKLQRREALWGIKGLRDEPLPLFAAAAEAESRTIAEQVEPSVLVQPMAEGSEVIQDYTHIGLSLRSHPLSFLRAELGRSKIVTCAEVMGARDGKWLETAGIVLVRQRPGSAKGVMFITLEDETGIANLVVWTKVFETYRRVVLGGSMIGIRGRVQREGEVVHLVAREMWDLTDMLRSVSDRGDDLPVPHARGDEVVHGSSGPDPRDAPNRVRDIYIPDLNSDRLNVKTRDFR